MGTGRRRCCCWRGGPGPLAGTRTACRSRLCSGFRAGGTISITLDWIEYRLALSGHPTPRTHLARPARCTCRWRAGGWCSPGTAGSAPSGPAAPPCMGAAPGPRRLLLHLPRLPLRAARGLAAGVVGGCRARGGDGRRTGPRRTRASSGAGGCVDKGFRPMVVSARGDGCADGHHTHFLLVSPRSLTHTRV